MGLVIFSPEKIHQKLLVFFLIFILNSQNLLAQYPSSLSEEDRTFLEKIQRDSFAYFVKFSNPKTGLVFDSSSPGAPSSIAATGFALAAYGIAQKHGWIGYRQAYEIIDKTLKTLETKAARRNGFYYHFIDSVTGKRIWSSELSSIDTALLIAGVLLAGQYFKGNIEKRAQKLYESIDWQWMLNGSFLLCHGWRPESGFLPNYWDMYS